MTEAHYHALYTAVVVLAMGNVATFVLCVWNAVAVTWVQRGVKNLHEVNSAVVARHDALFDNMRQRAEGYYDFLDAVSKQADERNEAFKRTIARVENDISDLDTEIVTLKDLIERERRGSKGGSSG